MVEKWHLHQGQDLSKKEWDLNPGQALSKVDKWHLNSGQDLLKRDLNSGQALRKLANSSMVRTEVNIRMYVSAFVQNGNILIKK